MKIINLKTKVYGKPKEILAKFTKDLLEKLTPPLINLEITQFDGTKKNGEVHIVASCLGNYQNWKNTITDHFESDHECYFTDVANEMPFPFIYWEHTHKIHQINETQSYIQDHIKYKCVNKIAEMAMYPVVYALMYYRKPIYMDSFKKD